MSTHLPKNAHRLLEEHVLLCPCFPGQCRGGEVINGRTAAGYRCKATIQARTFDTGVPQAQGYTNQDGGEGRPCWCKGVASCAFPDCNWKPTRPPKY